MSTSWQYSRSLLRSRFLNPSLSEEPAKPLDSSIKKVTSFIKKLKTITPEQVDPILNEMSIVKFSKYYDEVVASLLENKFRSNSEIGAFVHVAFEILNREPEVTVLLLEAIKKQLVPVREKDEEKLLLILARQKALLQIYMEFVLIGFKEANFAFVIQTIKAFVDCEPTNPNLFIPFIQSWCKVYTGMLQLEDGDSSETIPREKRVELRTFLSGYFKSTCGILSVAHKRLRKMKKVTDDAMFNCGDTTEEMKLSLSKAKKAFEKLYTNLDSLSQTLGLELPHLEAKDENTAAPTSAIVSIGGNLKQLSSDSCIWECEEDRNFYECITDLKLIIPHISAEEGANEKSSPSTEQEEPDISDGSIDDSFAEAQLSESAPIDESLFAGDFKSFSEAMFKLCSKETVDKLSIDYHSIHSKSNKKKLVMLLETLPRSKIDLIPFISRFLAIISPFFPSIATSLNASFLGQFRFLARKKTVLIESRFKIATWIGELTKFKVMPLNYAFWCLKHMIIDDFSHYNIDMACFLLENFGKYILFQKETAPRMQEMLDVMQKKRMRSGFEPRHIMLIDNPLYYLTASNEDRLIKEEAKVREPIVEFLRDSFFKRLSKQNLEPFFVCLQKLDWTKGGIVWNQLMKRFLKVWKIKYSNVELMAVLLGRIGREWNDEFVICVIDRLLEQSRLGLEKNDFRWNQQRIAICRYLSFLYHEQVIGDEIVFDTLYLLLFFGYNNPTEQANANRFYGYNKYDLKEDTFRITLICTLLIYAFSKVESTEATTVRKNTISPVNLKRLEFFLLHFSRYLLPKSPLAVDVEFCLAEAFSSLPISAAPPARFTSEEQINLAFSNLQKGISLAETAKFLSELSANAQPATENGKPEQEAEPSDNESSQEDDDLLAILNEEDLDEEFELEFRQMVNSGLRENREAMSSKVKGKGLDLAIPIFNQVSPQAAFASEISPETMPFKLLTKKKSSKIQVKEIHIPSSSALAISVQKSIKKEALEKAAVNKMTLNEVRKQQQQVYYQLL